MNPAIASEEADDADAATAVYSPPNGSSDVSATIELLAQGRPTDPVAARRLLANLERELIDRSDATPDRSRYVLLDQIGRGGLGVVCSAYDSQLDRRIALKFLHTRTDTEPRAQERLVREAKALAKLSHPNVVTVYDVGVLDGQVFIAMELVDGVPLSAWLRAKPRPWRQVRDLMVQAARGLQAAHEADLVHRDFKPQNVLVAADGRARVVDFGLARRLDATGAVAIPTDTPSAESVDERVTATGALVGTPAYMSPEQIEGAEVGARSDQFSFCVALFQGLYGARPFAGGPREVISAIARGDITSPQGGLDVPLWLHKAVMRGLSHHPADRFDSMRDLIAALTRDRRQRRRYGLLAVLFACLVGIVIGGAAMLLEPGVTDDERIEIDRRVAEARQAADNGDFVYPPVDAPERETAYRVVRDLERMEGAAGALAREEAEVLRTELAATLTELGDRYWNEEGGAPFAADFYASALTFDESNERARERASLTRGELRALAEKAEGGSFSVGELIAAQSLALLAEPDPQRRAERFDTLTESDMPPSTTTTTRLARLVGRTPKSPVSGEPTAREDETRRADGVAEVEAGSGQAPEPWSEPAPQPTPSESDESDDRGDAANDAGELVRRAKAAANAGQRDKARQLYHRALRSDRRNAKALGGLAQVYFDEGEHHEAVKFAQRAVAAAPRSRHFRVLLGDALAKVLDYQGAEKHYRRAVELGSTVARGRLELLSDRMGK